MFRDYFSMMVLAFTAPRKAARRVLTNKPGAGDALMLAVAAGCVFMVGFEAIEAVLRVDQYEWLKNLLAAAEAARDQAIAAGQGGNLPELPSLDDLGAPPPLSTEAAKNILQCVSIVFFVGGIAHLAANAEKSASFGASAAVVGTWLLLCYVPIALFSAAVVFATPISNALWATFAAVLLRLFSLYLLAGFLSGLRKRRT